MESSSCIFWRTEPFPLSSATKIKGQVVSCVAPGLPRKRFFLTTLERRRDPERGLQSWFRPEKPETRNPKPTVKVGFRTAKPETRNRLWRLTFPRTDRNPKPETRNPKPETRNRLLKLVSNCETRNPKPETDSEDLTSPGPIANLI